MSDFLVCILIVILLTNIFSGGFLSTDDTDEPNGKRSNMILYTDYKTGCQYVGTVLGGITPRLDRDGKPVCVGRSEPKP